MNITEQQCVAGQAMADDPVLREITHCLVATLLPERLGLPTLAARPWETVLARAIAAIG